MAIALRRLAEGDELSKRFVLPYVNHITRHIHTDASRSKREGNKYVGEYSAIETGRTVGSFRITGSTTRRNFSQPDVGGEERLRLREEYPEEDGLRYKRRVIFPIRPFRLNRAEIRAMVAKIFFARMNVVVRNDASYPDELGLIGLRIDSSTVRRPLLLNGNRMALLREAIEKAAKDYAAGRPL